MGGHRDSGGPHASGVGHIGRWGDSHEIGIDYPLPERTRFWGNLGRFMSAVWTYGLEIIGQPPSNTPRGH